MNPAVVLLPDLGARGVTIAPHEALAIVQSLMQSLPAEAIATAAPPGLLHPDNLELQGDGTVACAGFEVTPTVAEVAILLEALLARAAARPPGAVRYAIARAVHDVDAPPFDSLDEFARALARYAPADPRETVRALVARGVRRAPWPAAVGVEPAPDTAPEPVNARGAEILEFQPDRIQFDHFDADPFGADPFEPDGGIVVAPARPRSRRSRTAIAVAAVAAFAVIGGTVTQRYEHEPTSVPPPTSQHKPVETARHEEAPVPPTKAPAPTVAPTVGTTATANPEPDRSAPSATSIPAEPLPVPTATTGRVVEPDGGLVRALDDNQRPIFSPAFASNGSAMFFQTGGNRDRSSALMASERGDDGLRVITILDDGARNYHVHPSPDGSRVAFDSDRDGERGVYIASRDGSGVRRVSGGGYAAVPTWAPDGRSLTFVRAETDNPRVWNLWRLWLESGEQQRLTSYPYGETWGASWFRDGRRICYTHEDRIVILDLETGETRVFTSPVKRRLVRTPAVSPDGTKVIFQVHRNGAWLLDLADGSMRCVLTDPTAEEFAWTPDGRRVAFHSRRDGDWGIWVMAPG